MSDFERDYDIVYHWSPSTRREGIAAEGLRIGAQPCINGVEGDDHRNPWISVSPTPAQAWWLSGEAIHGGGFEPEAPVWDLYEINVADLKTERRNDDYPEIKVLESITPERITRIATRLFGDAFDTNPEETPRV